MFGSWNVPWKRGSCCPPNSRKRQVCPWGWRACTNAGSCTALRTQRLTSVYSVRCWNLCWPLASRCRCKWLGTYWAGRHMGRAKHLNHWVRFACRQAPMRTRLEPSPFFTKACATGWPMRSLPGPTGMQARQRVSKCWLITYGRHTRPGARPGQDWI